MGKKILYAASNMQHVNNFHNEYILALRNEGNEVLVMARGEGADFDVPFEKKFFSPKNKTARKCIKDILAKESFDTVILNTSLAAFHIRLALAKRNRPRVVNFVHGYLFSKDVHFIKRCALLLAEKLCASKTDSIITMNRFDYEAAIKYKLCKGQVYNSLGMGASPRSIEESSLSVRDELAIGDRFLLLFVGELSKRKNQEFLIRSMPDIIAHIPDATLLLVGEGDERQSLELLVKELSIEANVIFAGARRDVARIMRECDLYVSAATIEGMPFNVLEAMAERRTVLISDIKGHQDIIEEGIDGYLYKLNKREAFVKSVIEIYSDNKIESSAIYRKYLKYSKDEVFSKTLEVIRKAADL